MSRAREAARAAFLLDAAFDLGIKVGAANDGSEITIVAEPGVPRDAYRTLCDAILEVREAAIHHILVENGVRVS